MRELRAFEKIELAPGETKTVTFHLDKRAFAYWNTDIHDWHVQSGEYELQIGKNAQEILLSGTVYVNAETVIPKVFSLNSTIGEIMADPKGRAVFEQAMGKMSGAQEMQEAQEGDAAVNDEMMAAMMEAMPLRQLASFVPGLTKKALEPLLQALNS